MTETSRPRCQIAEWCAKPPHPPEEGCSIAVRIPDPPSLDHMVERFIESLTAKIPPPAVGGTVNQPHLTVPADRVQTVTAPADPDGVDVNRWIAAIRKANDAAAEYESIAYELDDLISRYRGLKSRQVQSPEDGENTAPALLSSSLVKLDMTEHLCRLERFQVAAMGAAGAWHMLAGRWDAQRKEELADEEERRRSLYEGRFPDPVRTCRACGCTDDEACEPVLGVSCSWVEDDLCSACQLKTPDEWVALTGTKILDPDGWRGSAGRPWTDPISIAEFQRRASVSTVDSAQVPR